MIPVFINNNLFIVIVPTPNGSGVVVPAGKYVKGSYYADHELVLNGTLTAVADPSSVNPNDIVFTWPESGSGTGTGITEIIAGHGLAGGGSTPTVTLALAAGEILADDIALGQVVKSLNGLTDAITLTAGAGITITEDAQAITIESDANTVTSAVATAPLVLEIHSGVLSGHIAVTAADNGGAVALQTTVPSVTQTGTVDVTTVKGATGTFGKLATGGIGLGGVTLETGNYLVENYAATFFACDAAGGVISIQLPLLSIDYPSGTFFVFIKTNSVATDSKSVIIAPQAGQTINGTTQYKLTEQYTSVRLVAITSALANYWLAF